MNEFDSIERTPAPSGVGVRSRLPAADWHVLVPVLLSIPVLASTAPIAEIDSYWHVVVGEELLTTRSVTGLGEAWAWYDPPEPWTTSQWLSEAAMAWLVATGGWDALVYATTVLSVALTLAISAVVLRRASGPRAVLLIALAVLPLVQWIQVRPATFSLLATVVVADAADRTLTRGRLPPLWAVPLVTVWANMHGQWVLAPIAVAAAAVLYWAGDVRLRTRFLVRAGGYVVLLAAAGCLTPLGPGGLALPLALRDATSHIDEWQPVYPLSWEFMPVALISSVLLWNWTRRQRPSTAEVVYLIGWLTFAVAAERNSIVAAMLLLPVAARSLGTQPMGFRASGSSFGKVAGVATTSTAVVLTSVALLRVDGLAEAEPLAIAQRLADDYESVRVLNDYNTAGVLVAFGPDGIELGIDGRAERYGREYIDRYLNTFALSGGEWQSFLADFEPEAAVIDPDDAILHLLVDDWDWVVELEDDPYVLLVPPS